MKKGLDDYRRKRDFEKTVEPSGESSQSGESSFRFVIQKHDATRLHYDLRLEMDGVLRSWAVPKGPSYDPSDKRLAVLVEDHPLEYLHFEGVIPDGQYGAGRMLVWDHGVYECRGTESDPASALKKGKLEFFLRGEKLRGFWVLVRTKGRGKDTWLFFKKEDEYVRIGQDILTSRPESVLSGRTLEEIDEASIPSHTDHLRRVLDSLQIEPGSGVEVASPMLATLVDKVPQAPHWIYELKYDGIRALAVKNGAEIKLFSRNLKPLEEQFPEIIEDLEQVPCDSFQLDGEIVALDDQGRPRFQLLQPRIGRRKRSRGGSLGDEVPAYFYVFDVLECDGYDLRRATLRERKKVLETLLPVTPRIRLTESVSDQGEELFQLACQSGLEGIVAKNLKSSYESKRTRSWLKIKCVRTQEFVIGGYTHPSGSRKHFGALLLGLFSENSLSYVGAVGSGFDQDLMDEVYTLLRELDRDDSPFDQAPKEVKVKSWVEPELVCEVKFNEWTLDGNLRAPVFLRLRSDVAPGSCRKEVLPQLQPISQRKPDLDFDFLTNLDKVFWPQEGYTKGDLVRYYHGVAEALLPYLRDRPMVLERFPDGIEGKSFYQKDSPEFLPEWIPTVSVRSDSSAKTIRYLLCNDAMTLVYLANLGCIPLHPWSSRKGSLEKPDFLIIDLDPGPKISFPQVCRVALKVREVTDRLELETHPKTSGATGLHILIPIEANHTYEDVRRFAEIIGWMTLDGLEDVATLVRNPQKRTDRVYIDFLQNGKDKTIVSPYSVRALPGAPVSTPLNWEEVVPALRPESFNLSNMLRRLDSKGDLYADLFARPQSLRVAFERLQREWEGLNSEQ